MCVGPVSPPTGSLRRELAGSWASTICIDWLPERVDIAALPPVRDLARAPEPTITLHGDHWAWLLSWSPDSTRLLAGRAPHEGHDPAFGAPHGTATLWDITTATPISTLPLIDWTEEPVWIPTTGPGSMIVYRALDDWYGLNVLAISPDESQEVTGIGVRDVTTGEKLLDFLYFGTHAYPGTVGYSGDGRLLAVPVDGVTVWDTTSWEVLATIPGSFQAVALSPDGRWLAASTSWDVLIWDTSTLLAQ